MLIRLKTETLSERAGGMLKDNIKRLRIENGMSQEELAERVHMVRQTVSKWERGASVPDADSLMALACVFGVSAAELLGEPVRSMSDKSAEDLALQATLDGQNVARLERFRRWARVGLVALAVLCALALFGGALLAKELAWFYSGAQTGFTLQGTYEDRRFPEEGVMVQGARLSLAEKADGGFDGFWQLSGYWDGPVRMFAVEQESQDSEKGQGSSRVGAWQSFEKREPQVANGGFVRTNDPNVIILQDEDGAEVGWAHVSYSAGRLGQEGYVYAEYQGVPIQAPRLTEEVAHYPMRDDGEAVTIFWAPCGVQEGVSAATWFSDSES